MIRSPAVILYDAAGVAHAVQNGVAIPANTPGLMAAGSDYGAPAASHFLKVMADGLLPLPVDTYSVVSLVTTSAGLNLFVNPASGKSVRLHYLHMNATGSNAGDVKTSLRFTNVGADLYPNSLKPGAIFARNVGAGRRYIQGAPNEALFLNFVGAGEVNATVEYEEV